MTVPRGTVVLQAIPQNFSTPTPIGDPSAQFYVLKDDIALRGSDITNPQQSTDPNAGQPDVTFDFTSEGKRAFENVTANIAHRGDLVSGLGQTLNQHFAVALDDQLITVPFIDFKQYPDGINGDNGADISGSFTITSAKDLANELRLSAASRQPHGNGVNGYITTTAANTRRHPRDADDAAAPIRRIRSATAMYTPGITITM